MLRMELKLPSQIASKRDVIKLQREIERLLDERLQQSISKEQVGDLRKVSNASRSLHAFFDHNQLEMTDDVLKKVMQHLEGMRQHSPVIRIAFANEPEYETSEQIVDWFRKNISPQALIQIGVQPMIAGGCVVQTPMKRYDFSLRKHILDSTDKFIEVFNRVS
jgi:F0F1-type ATP synthase delta subunit